MSSDIRLSWAQKNRNTELFPGYEGQPSVDLRNAYRMARAVARLQPDDRFGHRIVWVRRTAFASSTLVAHQGSYGIVGRHTQCSIVLADDPFVALRHLMVRSVELPSGRFALRVFDLHTNIGFGLVDGTRQTSVFAEGAVAISVGEYALVALPSGDYPDELPPPEIVQEARPAMTPYRANAIPLETSRLTLMPRPVSLDAIATTDGEFVIHLQRGGREAHVIVSSADLDRGVIIGRSVKCNEQLRNITDKGTSRVHLLLVREAGYVYAYDLASTQGTWAYGQRVGRTVLPDQLFVMHLGTSDPVMLTWARRR